MKKIISVALAAVLMGTAVAAPASAPLDMSITAEAATVKPATPTGLKATVSGSTVRLTWNKVKGADGYRIYIYDFTDKKYKKYKDVKGTSYEIKSLKNGKNYLFRVAAVKDGIVGTKSEKVIASPIGLQKWSDAALKFVKSKASNYYGYFSLCDVTNDGIPEIILSYFTGHPASVEIYTFNGRSFNKMDVVINDDWDTFTIWGEILYSPSLNTFAYMDGYGGTNDTYLYKINGNRIVRFAHLFDNDTSDRNKDYPVVYEINGKKVTKNDFEKFADEYNTNDYIALGRTYVIDRSSSYWNDVEEFTNPNEYASADEVFAQIKESGKYTQPENSNGSIFYIYR